MQIPLYQVDAFTSRALAGNPAAVCPLESWLDDGLMQAVARENNLSETAFFVPEEGAYRIRWFTPTTEVELCGHATLASAWVVFHRTAPESSAVVFRSRSGELPVTRAHERMVLDFPADPPRPAHAPPGLLDALGARPAEVLEGRYWLAVFDSEQEILDLAPDFRALALLGRPVIVTAPGRSVDFVSRCFAPSHGVDEDPVTGSAHTTLTPYWSRRLGKKILSARQVSARGGELRCDDEGERVHLSGRAVLYLEGTIHV